MNITISIKKNVNFDATETRRETETQQVPLGQTNTTGQQTFSRLHTHGYKRPVADAGLQGHGDALRLIKG